MDKFKIILVIFILLLGLILRLHNYSVYPQRGATSDEYTYSFMGVSLLTKGVPISWSAFPAYENRYDLTIRKLYFPIVYPYFDHPPLNGLLTGGFALLFGQDRFEEIDLKTIRLVPIFLSTVSSFLVFLLGFRLYGFKTAIWAILIYSTVTIFVINGRVVLAENLLTPLLLLSIYLFTQFFKKITVKKAMLFGVISGLSFWTKELGITVFVTMLFLFILEKIKLKAVLTLLVTFLFFVVGYLLYGAYYDWDVFLKVVTLQSSRDIGSQTLFYITSTPIIVNKIIYDGWYFLGFLSLFLILFDFAKHKIIALSASVYLFLLIFFLTERGGMGWYIIPLFPFMALASSQLLVDSIKKQGWFIFVLLLFVGLSQIKFLYEDNFGITSLQFRILTIVLFAPLTLLFLMKKERLFNLLSQIWFYLLILENIIITYNYIHPA